MKKFFKILMVFALLGGAALSCTKDYSKEIQDVQKQSQELQALITSLQNALNSTNATVAQLSKDLTAAKEKESADIAALQGKHEQDIKTLTQKATELEGLITKLQGQVTANATDIAKIKTALEGIESALKGLREDVDKNTGDIAANKALIEENIKAIEAAEEEIEKLWEAVGSLSARLTNIVAAPALTPEVATITVGDSVRTIINMDFVVAPAEAAEAIAAQYGENPDLKVIYTLYNGLDRAQQTKAEEELYSITAVPYRVECTSEGTISVAAVCAKEIIEPVGAEKKLYVTLTVAGKDDAGAFERVSDPVKPIISEGYTLYDELEWFKGNEKVAVAEGTIASIANKVKGVSEFKDTAYVQGKSLVIVAPDYDWKTLPKSNNDLVAGYELKWVVDGEAISLTDAAELLDLAPAELAPHFTANTAKKAYSKVDYKPYEWAALTFDPEEQEATYSDVFTATGDTTSLNLTLAVALKGTDPEKAEFVGASTKIVSNDIALGELGAIEGCNVTYVQRICKHLTEQKAADALHANFAFNASASRGAEVADTTFSSVAWKSSTSIEKHGSATIYVVEGGNVTTKANGTATVEEMQSQSKFVNVALDDVYFKATAQDLKIVWKNDTYKNGSNVVTEVYTDYIDLTVDPFHAPVALNAAVDSTKYICHSEVYALKTDLTVKAVFGDDKSWFLNETKAADLAQKGALLAWFTNHVNATTPHAASIVPALEAGKTVLEEVYLTVDTDGYIVVNAPANTIKHFVDGKEYTVTVNDSIDNVIKFNYTIKFKTAKVGAKIETIPGYVKNDSVYVNGNSVRATFGREYYSYRIDDINLTQYFRLANVDEKNAKDSLSAIFATTAKVNFINNPAPHEYGWFRDPKETTKGAIDYDAKISWNGYDKNYFDLAATAAINHQAASEDSIYVRFWTVEPIIIKNATGNGTMKVGEEKTFNLFEDFNIVGVVDTTANLISNVSYDRFDTENILVANAANTPDYGFNTNDEGFIAPQVADYKLWECYVDDEKYPYAQMMELFADYPNWEVVYEPHYFPGRDLWRTNFALDFREHSAPATITFVIPCTWKYAIGTLNFKYVYTLVVE